MSTLLSMAVEYQQRAVLRQSASQQRFKLVLMQRGRMSSTLDAPGPVGHGGHYEPLRMYYGVFA